MTDNTGQTPSQPPTSTGGESQPDTATFTREYVEQLRSENAQRRTENRDLRQQLTAIQHSLQQLGVTPDGSAQATQQQLQQVADTLQHAVTLEQQVRQSSVHLAVVAEAARAGIADPEDALRLADLSAIALTPDGSVSGAAEAVKALVETKPYLLRGKTPPNIGPTNPAGPGNSGPSETIRSRLTGQGNTFGG